jgi:putative hydrolase of the HAD superfamily
MSLDRYLRFKNCFDQFYLSHEIKMRKPDKSIYEFVLNENKLIAKHCFFIDDTKENTDAAKQLGIKTWNNDPKSEDIISLFYTPNFIKS